VPDLMRADRPDPGRDGESVEPAADVVRPYRL